MSPETKWLVGLIVFIVACFIVSCAMLWRREHTDRKAAQKNATRRLSDYAEQVKPTPPQLIGRNGRSNRTGAPIGRKAGR